METALPLEEGGVEASIAFLSSPPLSLFLLSFYASRWAEEK